MSHVFIAIFIIRNVLISYNINSLCNNGSTTCVNHIQNASAIIATWVCVDWLLHNRNWMNGFVQSIYRKAKCSLRYEWTALLRWHRKKSSINEKCLCSILSNQSNLMDSSNCHSIWKRKRRKTENLVLCGINNDSFFLRWIHQHKMTFRLSFIVIWCAW